MPPLAGTIDPADLETIKSRVDLVAIVSEHLHLKRVGGRYVGRCPFHADNSPSFSVNGILGVYHCFGCGESGDVISFVRKIRGSSFREAVESLASTAGVQLASTPEDDLALARRRTLSDILSRSAAFWHETLLSSPSGAGARSYLRSRGYTGEEVRLWGIGWSDGSSLRSKMNCTEKDLVDAGLAIVTENGRINELFKHRVMFPIRSHTGQVIGFGGRILQDGAGPKYVNSPATDLYAKQRVLYGLDVARVEAVKVSQLVICEGYTDVHAFHRAGIRNAVAACGTAFTADHVGLASRWADALVLAFDSDTAGSKATSRLHAAEKSANITISVASFPPGLDPAEFAATNLGGLKSAIDTAEPLLGWQLGQIVNLLGSNPAEVSPEKRLKTLRECQAVAAAHPDKLLGYERVKLVALLLDLPVPSGTPAPGIVTVVTKNEAVDHELNIERKAAGFLVQQPDLSVCWTHETLFSDPTIRRLVAAMFAGDLIDQQNNCDLYDVYCGLQTIELEGDPFRVHSRLILNAAKRAVRALTAAGQTDNVIALQKLVSLTASGSQSSTVNLLDFLVLKTLPGMGAGGPDQSR